MSEQHGYCHECGKPMFITCDGITHHETSDQIGEHNIDYSNDRDHVAILDELLSEFRI